MITTSAELEDLIDSTVNIPTVPTTLLEIHSVVSSPDGSAQEAGALLERDPAIGAKALRLVNSPVYGLRNPVSSITLACSILGLETIKNLVFQATLIQRYEAVPALADFDPQALWTHSFRTAVAARMIAARAAGVGLDRNAAYTCGLVHDIGKMVLLDSTPERFADALDLAARRGIPLAKAEAELFGFSHAHVGGLLAQRWKLAPDLQAAVMYHHSPAADAESWARGFVIAAANTAAHLASADEPTPWTGDVLHGDSLAALGVSDEDWRTILGDVAMVSAEL